MELEIYFPILPALCPRAVNTSEWFNPSIPSEWFKPNLTVKRSPLYKFHKAECAQKGDTRVLNIHFCPANLGSPWLAAIWVKGLPQLGAMLLSRMKNAGNWPWVFISYTQFLHHPSCGWLASLPHHKKKKKAKNNGILRTIYSKRNQPYCRL